MLQQKKDQEKSKDFTCGVFYYLVRISCFDSLLY